MSKKDQEEERINRIQDRLSQVQKVFTPHTPIRTNEFFAGRVAQLGRLLEVSNNRGQHAVIFGERGVGKTSIANIISGILNTTGSIVCKYACTKDTSFKQAMLSLYSQIEITAARPPVGFLGSASSNTTSLASYFPKDVSINDSVDLLVKLGTSKPIIFVIDEYDRIPSTEEKSRFSEFMKSISDKQLAVTVILVGVSDDLSSLVEDHESVNRIIREISVPLMTPDEIRLIVTKGATHLGITVPKPIENSIVELSHGFPYITHLICFHICNAAIVVDQNSVTVQMLRQAVAEAVDAADQRLKEAYSQATASIQTQAFADVLYAAARANIDQVGSFAPTDVSLVPINDVGDTLKLHGLYYPLSQLIRTERGAILKRVGVKKRYRYKFRDPMMRQYIIMKQSQHRGIL